MGYINNSICATFGSCKVSLSMILERFIGLLILAVIWVFIGFASIKSVSDKMIIEYTIQNVLIYGFIAGSALFCIIIAACFLYALGEIVYDITLRDAIENIKDSLNDFVIFKCDKPQR